MRSSRSSMLLVALIVTATCIHTGCRLGGMSLSRPKLLSFRHDKPKDIASTKPKPPLSSIPPAGTDVAEGDSARGSGSRSFPSQPAPNSDYGYASTSGGSGDYTPRDSYGSRDNYGPRDSYSGGTSPSSNYRDDPYVATSGGNNGSQRGFYNPDAYGPAASHSGGTRNSYAGDSRAAGGSYDGYNASGSGYDNASYPSGYGGSERVADVRGGASYDSYNDRGAGGGAYDTGASYDRGGYGAGSYDGGGSGYGSSNEGNSYDSYQSPATGRYDSGASYDAGASYDSGANYEAPASYDARSAGAGSYNNPYDNAAPASSGDNYSAPPPTTPSFLPGSTGRTTPYGGQKQLSPPTDSGWGTN